MFTDQEVDYSLNIPARCLSSFPSPNSPNTNLQNSDIDSDYEDHPSSSSHRFLVGSAVPSLSNGRSRDDGQDVERTNSIHVIHYNDDSHELTPEASFPHVTGEVWSMSCHPVRSELVTCGGGIVVHPDKSSSVASFQTTLWRIPETATIDEGDYWDQEDEDAPKKRTDLELELESILVVPHGESSSSEWDQRVGCILWNPLLSSNEGSSPSASLLTVGWNDSSPISLWDISTSTASPIWSAPPTNPGRFAPMRSALPRRASWDPHDTSHLLAISGSNIVAYDTRTAGSTGILRAHRFGVADLCHNPLRSNMVLTSGLDGCIKFWDLRMLSGRDEGEPVLKKVVRGGHSHWATRAMYNPWYDQLVLSGGSDGVVNLWRVSSCSSAPLLDLDGEEDDEGGGGFMMEDEADEDGMDDVGAGDGWGDEDKEETVERKETKNVDEDHDLDETEIEKVASSKNSTQDIRVTRFECSNIPADVTWSSGDPWLYATLSCDGTLAVHHVPSKEKYKILL